MHIVFAAVEALPFAKIGGVADVLGCLPKELETLGHRVQVILPLHAQVERSTLQLQKTEISFSFLGKEQKSALWKSTFPDSDIPVYFIDHPHYFNREQLYGFYEDNAERFAFFSIALLEVINVLKIPCQVLHLHDWPTALAPLYLKLRYRNLSHFRNTSTLLTVHNLIYQGLFPAEAMSQIDIPQEYFHLNALEFYGQINFLKAGLLFADNISTVSRTHAQDIQSQIYGNKLDGVFRKRKAELFGIVNGVDYSLWNPVCDPYIPFNYTDSDLSGKNFCKHHLQRTFQLNQGNTPVLAMISRLDRYKGLDLVVQVLPKILEKHPIHFVLLGQGESTFIDFFQKLRDQYPTQVGVYFSYNESLAHLIEAGSDMYLMPSFSEPCGLNQLYSMKYGTVPIVRKVGGLADTVLDYSSQTFSDESATGFTFSPYTAEALEEAIERALKVYHQPILWNHLQYLIMQKDWSWGKRAREYVDLYHLTLPKD